MYRTTRTVWSVALLATANFFCLYNSASADLIASDDFESYSLGDIVGQGAAGNGWLGAYGGDAGSQEIHEVVNGALVGLGQSLAVGRGSGTGTWTRNSVVLREFNSQVGDKLYVGFLVQPDLTTDGTTNDFMQIYLNNLSGTATQGTSYSGGIEDSSFFARKGGEDQVYGTATATSGTLYQVVLAFSKSVSGADENFDSVAIYVNQPTETSPDVSLGPGDAGTVDLPSMSYFHVRLSGLEGGDRFYIDNLRIATTYAEAIPEPSCMVLASVGVILGIAVLRKRNAV